MLHHHTLKEAIALERYRDWGVYPGPWLWGQNLRILIVIDGSVSLSTVGFGIGKILQILRDPTYAWWVDFAIDVAQRGSGPPVTNPSPGPFDAKYTGFRFNQPAFDLNAYDQAWFFGFHPGNDAGPDSNISNPMFAPLDNAELALLATWMDAGGGVFATGDHDYLGASLCSRIPRVRTMRKWTNAQGVPPIDGPTRYDTNQPANAFQAASLQFMPFELQGDSIPQPIDVVMEPLWDRFPFLESYAPHPILCAPGGIIDVFPDHPHEGEVIADAEVKLDLPLGITGYSGVEYPGGPSRPKPKIIAYGRSTHLQTNRTKDAVSPKRFGLIGAYDGDSAGIGRVVVDSTWHHWFSENLVGFESGNPSVFALLKQYYRNVAIWLATPTQRAGMLTAATWGVVIATGPMEFTPKARIWDLGGRALDVIGRTASQCTIREWTWPYFEVEVFKPIRVPDPCYTCPPSDLLERSILGGIAKAMANVAFTAQQGLSLGERPVPQPREIVAAVTAGVRLGRRDATRGLNNGAKSASALARATARARVGPRLVPPNMGIMTVSVSIHEIELLDTHDPALADDSFALTLTLVVDDLVGAQASVRGLTVPEFGARGAVLRVDMSLGEVTVWKGTDLDILLVAGPVGGRTPPPDQLRGRMHFEGNPRNWLGSHRPSVESADRWRMRVQIERIGRRNPSASVTAASR
jgi:hypothetical protein